MFNNTKTKKIFLVGGQNGWPGYQGDLDLTGSETERNSTSITSLVTNNKLNLNENASMKEIENKRKEMLTQNFWGYQTTVNIPLGDWQESVMPCNLSGARFSRWGNKNKLVI